MINWKKLKLDKQYTIDKLDDIPSGFIKSLVFKTAYSLLAEMFEYDADEIEDIIETCESEEKEIPFRTLGEFKPDHICHYFTYEAMWCENHGYRVNEISEKDNPENQFYIITLQTGNPKGYVFQKGTEGSILFVEDGTVSRLAKHENKPLLCKAMDIVYSSSDLGETVEDWLNSGHEDIKYYPSLVDAL